MNKNKVIKRVGLVIVLFVFLVGVIVLWKKDVFFSKKKVDSGLSEPIYLKIEDVYYAYLDKKAYLVGLNTNLEKETLIEDVYQAIDGYDIYDNHLYYFDSKNELNRYDFHSKNVTKLKMKLNDYNANLEMIASKKYLFIQKFYDFYIYDLENNIYEKIKINIDNSSFVFNEDKNELYYIFKNKLYAYNVLTKESAYLVDDARPLKVEKNCLYYSNLDDTNFYKYDFLSNSSVEISKNDYKLSTSENNEYYDFVDKMLVKVNESGQENILSLDNIDFIFDVKKVGEYLLVEAGNDITSEEDCTDNFDLVYYSYNLKNGNLTEFEY